MGAPPGSGPLAPLRVTYYRRIWYATLTNGVGTYMQLTAAPWLMLQLTGSPLMVSLVMTALMLPSFVFTLPAGALADSLDRRTIMLAAQTVATAAAGAMAVLAMTDRLSPWTLLGLTFLLGTGNAVGQPSFQTFVPDLVPRPLLAQAITLTVGSFNVTRALGPSIGGALVAAGLTHVAFAMNALSHLFVIAAVFSVRTPPDRESGRHRLWRSTIVGLRYARFTRPVRVLLVVAAAFSITSASVQALLPTVVAFDLDGDARAFGALYAAFGVGAVVAALGRERLRALTGRSLLPVAVITFGLAGVGLGLARSLPVAGVAVAIAGCMWIVTITTLNASIQILAPRWVRGRIVSLFVLTFGLQPVGALLAGALAERLGSATAVAVMSAAALAVGILLTRVSVPVLDELRAPAPAPADWVAQPHTGTLDGKPIVVVTTWTVARADVPRFLDTMRALRRHRLRTGATRWSLFRESSDPCHLTEMYSVPDWNEHLAQHRRLDADVVVTLQRAIALHQGEPPVTRHLAGVDLTADAIWDLDEELQLVHEHLHETDGSLPLARDETRTAEELGETPG